MARLTGVDVSVFDVGGSSVLADLRSAEVISETRFADVTPVVLGGQVREAVKQSASIRGALMSTKTGGSKVTHLDISTLALAELDYRAVTENGVFEGRMQMEDGSGLGDEWEFPITVRKDYRARLELAVDSAGSPNLVAKAFGALIGKDVGFSIEINGVVVALPMKLAEFKHRVRAGHRQKWIIDLLGSAGVGVAYPLAPLGASTILEHSFNSPGTALPIEVVSGTGQPQIAGNFLVRQFGFQFDRGSVVDSKYDFVSQGPVVLA